MVHKPGRQREYNQIKIIRNTEKTGEKRWTNRKGKEGYFGSPH